MSKTLARKLMLMFARMLIVAPVVLLGGLVSAHEVQPVRQILNLGQGNYESVITVRNTRNRDLTVEMVALRRVVAEDGSQTFLAAEDDFIVFPPQFILPEGASQAVRFRYIGDPDLRESASYILEARELPVVPEGFSGIITVYNVGASILVQPANARARLEIAGVERDGNIVRFQITNTGNDYSNIALNQMSLRFGAQTIPLSAESVNEIISNPLVPPNSTRRFEMDVSAYPDGIPEIRFGRF